jgi:putative serine protease PepD
MNEPTGTPDAGPSESTASAAPTAVETFPGRSVGPDTTHGVGAEPTHGVGPETTQSYPWSTSADTSTDTVGNPVKPRRSLGLLAVLVLVAVVALIAGLVGGVAGYALENHSANSLTDSNASLGAIPQGSTNRSASSVAGVAAAALPVVVSVSVQSAAGGDTGSGFIVRQDGYILTNNHVVAAAASGGKITVSFNNGSTIPAKVVGTDESADLAVLKVNKTGLPVAQLGNSDDAVVGDQVIAVGSPLGLSGTVTSGIISATNRPVTTGGTTGAETSYISALQTDAAINPGNSGGPLINMQGQVIGVNSAIASLGAAPGQQAGNIGVGFAIPINQARRIAEELIKTGTAQTPIVGVNLDPTYRGPGAKILSHSVNGQAPIMPGGPAATAGLQPGDVITAVDGTTVPDAEALIVTIRSHAPGDVVTLTINRNGTTSDVKVTLGSTAG